MQNVHGKEIDLLRTTVKVPGKRLPRAATTAAPAASASSASPKTNGLAKERSALPFPGGSSKGPGLWGPGGGGNLTLLETGFGRKWLLAGLGGWTVVAEPSNPQAHRFLLLLLLLLRQPSLPLMGSGRQEAHGGKGEGGGGGGDERLY